MLILENNYQIVGEEWASKILLTYSLNERGKFKIICVSYSDWKGEKDIIPNA